MSDLTQQINYLKEAALYEECSNIMRHEDYGVSGSDRALEAIDKLLKQIDEAYQEWRVDGGDIRDWVRQIKEIRASITPNPNPTTQI